MSAPAEAPVTRPSEPRSARGRRTRDALVEAARGVFEASGFLDARTTDISEAAGVAHGSFYTYFRDKEAIFAAVMDAVQGEALGVRAAQARAGGEDDPVALIRAGHRAYLEAYRRNARLMAAMEQAALVDDELRRLRIERGRAFARRNARAIAGWQRDGHADPALDPLKAAHALDAMASRLAELTYVHGQRMAMDDLVELLTRMWAGALGMPYPPDKEH